MPRPLDELAWLSVTLNTAIYRFLYHALVLVLIFTSFSACSSEPDIESGWIVVGPAVEEFGFQRGDTVPEVPGTAVPIEVRNATRELAHNLEYDARCSRYFAADQRFLVLLIPLCKRGVDLSDGHVLASLDSSGTLVETPIVWITPDVVRELYPYERYRSRSRPTSW